MNWNCALLAIAAVFNLAAQTPETKLTCDEHSGRHHRLATHCEIKEQTMPAAGGVIDIAPGENGGVHVNGWDRADVLVRARIQTSAPTDAEARAMTPQIRFASGAASLHAQGPATDRDHEWSLDYEIFAPRNSDLKMTGHNGGVHVENVNGNIQFHTVNGGVHLDQVNGDVYGETANGGIHISLAGDRWNGKGMNVKTTNGGITLQASPQFSAHLEVSTENGGIQRDGASLVHASSGRVMAFEMGSGGPTIHLETVNGGVKISTGSKAL